ncbi:hypothetical protein [Breoghania sp.]|uniref:ABC transporter ATP-binding protein n=1 Tax=Breoghania sp. TaxID=2065378 RepID=UPI00260609C8|nr:hypothetical protein [Breoghania sp.]MDJ0932779.1 hypothetical protein [Breoghania sp.]
MALARAFAPRPRILLLDEPLSALDVALRTQLRDELAQLLRRFGITAIFVTHDQNEAMTIADRVAVMGQGPIAQIGTPETLYRNLKMPFVARFVGNAMPLGGSIEENQLNLKGGVLSLGKPANGLNAFVRAEDVRLDSDGPLGARVESITFLGTHYRIPPCRGRATTRSSACTRALLRPGWAKAFGFRSLPMPSSLCPAKKTPPECPPSSRSPTPTSCPTASSATAGPIPPPLLRPRLQPSTTSCTFSARSPSRS